MKNLLLTVYERLFDDYGPQKWWPADSRFEVMVGAILTQNTSWTNVEKSVSRLKAAGVMSPVGIRITPQAKLAQLVYSSGYYNMKARKLKAFTNWLGEKFDDDIEAMTRQEVSVLRPELLNVYGIGEETADDILLYALGIPIFVIDTYTKRLTTRLGLAPSGGKYCDYQDEFMNSLPRDTRLFNEYHALIVTHSNNICTKREPQCGGCSLLEVCPTGQSRHM